MASLFQPLFGPLLTPLFAKGGVLMPPLPAYAPTRYDEFKRGLSYLSGSGWGATEAAWTTTRASEGSYAKADGSLIWLPANTMRRGDRGLLVEETRTNILPASQNLSGSGWLATDGTITADAALGADGSQTADLLTEGTAGTAALSCDATGTTASAAVSGSCFLKRSANNDWVQVLLTDSAAAQGMHCWVNLATGALGTVANRGSSTNAAAAISSSANGLWLLRMSCTMAAGASNAKLYCRSVAGNGSTTRVNNAAYYVWQADYQIAPFVLSPIRTTSGAVTRPADNVSRALEGNFSQTEGTVVIKARTAAGNSANQVLWQIDDGTANNRVVIYRDTSRNLIWQVVAAGSQTATGNLGAVADNTDFTVCFGWKASDFAASLNGAAPVTAAAGALPLGLTTERMGQLAGPAALWNSNIDSSGRYNVKRFNAEIQALGGS